MRTSLLATVLLAATAAPLATAGVPCLMDPVTTFTNGMALPSTDPYRSHNAHWQCDPYRPGCCGGHYNCPCLAFGLFPNRCGETRRSYTPGDDCRYGTGSFENVEPNAVVTLGQLPAPTNGLSATRGPQNR